MENYTHNTSKPYQRQPSTNLSPWSLIRAHKGSAPPNLPLLPVHGELHRVERHFHLLHGRPPQILSKKRCAASRVRRLSCCARRRVRRLPCCAPADRLHLSPASPQQPPICSISHRSPSDEIKGRSTHHPRCCCAALASFIVVWEVEWRPCKKERDEGEREDALRGR